MDKTATEQKAYNIGLVGQPEYDENNNHLGCTVNGSYKNNR